MGSFSVKKLPINMPPYMDVPDITLNVISPMLINGFIYPLVDEKKYLTMSRPGISSTVFSNLNNKFPVNGLWWWPSKKYVLAVCNGKLFTINIKGTTTQITGAELGNGKARFVQAGYDGEYAFIASETSLAYTDGSFLKNPNGLGRPENCTHIGYMNGRIFVNDGNYFKWTDPYNFTADLVLGSDNKTYMCINAHISTSNTEPGVGLYYTDYWQEYTEELATIAWVENNQYWAGWQGLNVASMESRGDTIQGLDTRFDEVILFGKNSIEYRYDAGDGSFPKYEGTTSEIGSISPDSIIFDGNFHWFMDSDRNIIKLVNRSPVVVSNPVASILQSFKKVDDCFMMAIKCDGRNFLVITFPTDNYTLAYDVQTELWCGQWGTWNTFSSNFDKWIAVSYCKCPEWGFDLVGTADGKIYKISKNYATDAGTLLRMVKRTGWVDYGTNYKKRSNRIRLNLRRGEGEALSGGVEPDPEFSVKTRTDDSQGWGNERFASLGKSGDINPQVEFRINGIFGSKQDEYCFTTSVPITIIDCEEEVELLSR